MEIAASTFEVTETDVCDVFTDAKQRTLYSASPFTRLILWNNTIIIRTQNLNRCALFPLNLEETLDYTVQGASRSRLAAIVIFFSNELFSKPPRCSTCRVHLFLLFQVRWRRRRYSAKDFTLLQI
ncbi:hypothetical protein M758_10G167800 [Ceratodon purpureus]|nr:hypothetical protein M758_10G167800 [Ceratodon purpureus]